MSDKSKITDQSDPEFRTSEELLNGATVLSIDYKMTEDGRTYLVPNPPVDSKTLLTFLEMTSHIAHFRQRVVLDLKNRGILVK